MKKRLSTLLMLIFCVFALTACGETEKKLLIDVNNAEEVTLVQSIAGSVAEIVMMNSDVDSLAFFAELNEDELDDVSYFYQTQTSGYLKMDGKAIYAGAESYANGLEELGDITAQPGVGSVDTWDITEDKLIVNYELVGSDHTGYIEIIFDKNMHVTSATTNIDYSMSELMSKAGVNTAMGMGTVFVMLIVISIIISLFQFIPKIQAAFQKKDKAADVDNSVNNAIADIIEREEASEEDDLELIAVIAAAIAASEGASSTDGFVVRSIKRIR